MTLVEYGHVPSYVNACMHACMRLCTHTGMPSSSLFMHVLLRLHVCNIHARYRGLTTNKAQIDEEGEGERGESEGGRAGERERERVREVDGSEGIGCSKAFTCVTCRHAFHGSS